MNSVKLAGVAGLALLLGACGGNEEPTEAATTPAVVETIAIGDESAAPESFTQCKACHSIKPGENGIGPTLSDIYNSIAGEVPDYEFSPEMAQSGLKWDDATLDKWLTDPVALVPGTKMSFAGIKDEAKRKEVIEYLKTL